MGQGLRSSEGPVVDTELGWRWGTQDRLGHGSSPAAAWLSLSRSIRYFRPRKEDSRHLRPRDVKGLPLPPSIRVAPTGELWRSAQPGSGPAAQLQAQRRWLPMSAPPVPWRPSSPCASSSGRLALKDAAFPTVLIKLGAGDLGQGLERLVEIGDELTILALEKCRGRGAFS